MSNLNTNLSFSQEACDYVLNNIKIEGANWDYYIKSTRKNSYEHCMGTGGNATTCKKRKNYLDACLYGVTRPEVDSLIRSTKTKGMINRIKIVANAASRNQCGNCGEFAAAAFHYLYNRKARPIELVSLDGNDHAFVIIGRDNGDINQYKSWNKEAVICDPWGRGLQGPNQGRSVGTYAGEYFESNMSNLVGSFTGVNVTHREEK